MAATSAATAAALLTGVLGGTGAGQIFFSCASRLCTVLSALASLRASSLATLSIIRSACHTKPREVLILDRLGDTALHDRPFVFIGRGLERHDRGRHHKAWPILFRCLEPGVAGGKRLHHRLQGRGVVRTVLLFHRIGELEQCAVERRRIVVRDLVLDATVELFRGVQEMRHRCIPLPGLDQLIPDQQVAADQCERERELEIRRQIGRHSGLARLAAGRHIVLRQNPVRIDRLAHHVASATVRNNTRRRRRCPVRQRSRSSGHKQTDAEPNLGG